MVPATHSIETDAVVIGAGPVGLFQAFQLGLQDIRCHIIEALPHAGGQCAELYGDKPIYDIPAIAECSGAELTERLLEQVAPLHPTFHFNALVSELQRLDDGRIAIKTSSGQQFVSRVVCIACGVGAFQPRRLQLEGVETLNAGQLTYLPDAAQTYAGEDIVVFGDTESALQWALHLARSDTGTHNARSVTVVHRRDVFRASAQTEQQFRDAVARGHIDLCIGQPSSLETFAGDLQGVLVTDSHAVTKRLPVQRILVLMGLSPKLGPINHWGLALERKQLPVRPLDYATSERGIFAVGDINTYPGKRKLILCGFHEATLAAFGAASIVFPDKTPQLQYTTTSSHLHQLLGKRQNPTL